MAKYVGSRVRSKEAPRHVTGGGHYTDDLSFPGMLYAVILRSPHAHARILSVDTHEAAAAPGVVAVVTPQDFKDEARPFKPGRYAAGLRKPIPEYACAMDKVRYVGEPVAALAARSRGAAEDALELISVDYETLPPVVDTKKAMETTAPLLYDELGSNVAWKGTLTYGNIEGAFRSADKIVKERLKIHRYSSTPLEPFACIASFDAASKKLTVHVNAQVPEVIYDALREALGLEDVRVIIPDIGGGFGKRRRRGHYPGGGMAGEQSDHGRGSCDRDICGHLRCQPAAAFFGSAQLPLSPVSHAGADPGQQEDRDQRGKSSWPTCNEEQQGKDSSRDRPREGHRPQQPRRDRERDGKSQGPQQPSRGHQRM